MRCRLKENFEYVIASKETAPYILDKIEFGVHKCAETYDRDKRYGAINETEIRYGFENSMYGSIWYGRYVVFGCSCLHLHDDFEVLTEDEFNEEFEKCE